MSSGLLEVVIVWKNFGEEVDLESLRDRLVLLNSPVVFLSVYDTVFWQDFLCGDVTPGADDAPIGQLGGPAHLRLGLEDIVVSDLESVGGAVDLEHVVVSDNHDGDGGTTGVRLGVDDPCPLLDQVVVPDDYRSGFGDDLSLGVYHSPSSNCHITC